MVQDRSETASDFSALLGTEWLDLDPNHSRARIQLRDELRQPLGLLHGGVISTLVETVCSHSTALAVLEQEMMAMGQSIAVNFIRPITEGWVEVGARARHRGRTSWVWEAEITDPEGRLCALAQMTVAVRSLPGSN
jgi:1,4-dihydroxy-2-naphthoyl-CoA hydrolase